jgi:hypothetical protein
MLFSSTCLATLILLCSIILGFYRSDPNMVFIGIISFCAIVTMFTMMDFCLEIRKQISLIKFEIKHKE